jgi:hypothetical protein
VDQSGLIVYNKISLSISDVCLITDITYFIIKTLQKQCENKKNKKLFLFSVQIPELMHTFPIHLRPLNKRLVTQSELARIGRAPEDNPIK